MLKVTLDELKVHPWATGFSALAAALVGLSNSPLWIGVEAFLVDSVTLVLLLVSMAAWARQLWEANQTAPSLLLDASGKSAQPARTRNTTRKLSLIFFFALGGCFVWTLRAPIAHVIQLTTEGRWVVCGEFQPTCGSTGCIRLVDAHGRPIGQCNALQDASGYIAIRAPSLLSYRPKGAVAVCGNQESRSFELTDIFFAPNCSGKVRFP
jgi:hypothetical protein